MGSVVPRREEPKMDDDVREFGTALGRAALAQSWATVHGMLAPWLRSAQSVDE
jgi:hypothetical protein